jgi:hypothetical protein
MTRSRRSSSASIQAAVSTLPKSKKRTVTDRSPAVKSRKERKTDDLQSPTSEVQDKENVTPSKNSTLEDIPRATPYWKVRFEKFQRQVNTFIAIFHVPHVYSSIIGRGGKRNVSPPNTICQQKK